MVEIPCCRVLLRFWDNDRSPTGFRLAQVLQHVSGLHCVPCGYDSRPSDAGVSVPEPRFLSAVHGPARKILDSSGHRATRKFRSRRSIRCHPRCRVSQVSDQKRHPSPRPRMAPRRSSQVHLSTDPQKAMLPSGVRNPQPQSDDVRPFPLTRRRSDCSRTRPVCCGVFSPRRRR